MEQLHEKCLHCHFNVHHEHYQKIILKETDIHSQVGLEIQNEQ